MRPTISARSPRRSRSAATRSSSVGSEREIMRYRRPQTRSSTPRAAPSSPGSTTRTCRSSPAGLAHEEVQLAGHRRSTRSSVGFRAGRRRTRRRRGSPAAAGQRRHSPRPTRAQLDAVAQDRPAVLLSADAPKRSGQRRGAARGGNHAQAGNGPRTIRPRSPRRADRRLRGTAIALVRRAMPTPTRDDRARALSAAIRDAQRAWHYQCSRFREQSSAISISTSAADRHHARQDVRVYVAVPVSPAEHAAATLEALAKQLPDDPLFKTGLAYRRAGASGRRDLNRTAAEIDRRHWQIAVGKHLMPLSADALAAFDAAARSNTPSDCAIGAPGSKASARCRRLTCPHSRAGVGRRAVSCTLPGSGRDRTTTMRRPWMCSTGRPARYSARPARTSPSGRTAPSGPADPLASIAAVSAREIESPTRNSRSSPRSTRGRRAPPGLPSTSTARAR